jgi:hypothetical protein
MGLQYYRRQMEQDLWQKIEEVWQQTKIVKSSKRKLYTFGETHLPYILLAKSFVRDVDTVVRKGEVVVGRPLLFGPNSNHPVLEGFGDIGQELRSYVLSRVAYIPPYKYSNGVHSVRIMSEIQENLIEKISKQLDAEEDILTGVIKGRPDFWEVSVMKYVAEMIVLSLPSNVRDLKEHGFLEN